MRYKVTIEFRDDTSVEYICLDAPYMSEWITLYLDDDEFSRLSFPREAIKQIKYGITKKP